MFFLETDRLYFIELNMVFSKQNYYNCIQIIQQEGLVESLDTFKPLLGQQLFNRVKNLLPFLKTTEELAGDLLFRQGFQLSYQNYLLGNQDKNVQQIFIDQISSK